MEGLIRYDGRPRLAADLDPVPADRLHVTQLSTLAHVGARYPLP